MSESDIRAERIKKLALLKAAGMEAYPARTAQDTSIIDFLGNFDKREKDGDEATIAGRVMSLRGQGGIMFADMFDGSTPLTTSGTAKVQIVLQETDIEEKMFALFRDAVDIGDFIEGTGVAYKTKRGEPSLKVNQWKMLSKSLLPIPSERFGLKDDEKRLREREIDILTNAELRDMFLRRSRFWQAARDFYR